MNDKIFDIGKKEVEGVQEINRPSKEARKLELWTVGMVRTYDKMGKKCSNLKRHLGLVRKVGYNIRDMVEVRWEEGGEVKFWEAKVIAMRGQVGKPAKGAESKATKRKRERKTNTIDVEWEDGTISDRIKMTEVKGF